MKKERMHPSLPLLETSGSLKFLPGHRRGCPILCVFAKGGTRVVRIELLIFTNKPLRLRGLDLLVPPFAKARRMGHPQFAWGREFGIQVLHYVFDQERSESGLCSEDTLFATHNTRLGVTRGWDLVRLEPPCSLVIFNSVEVPLTAKRTRMKPHFRFIAQQLKFSCGQAAVTEVWFHLIRERF